MEFLQWAIPVVVGILGILAGRAWQRHDRNIEKDKEIYTKILEILPHDDMLSSNNTTLQVHSTNRRWDL